MEIRLKYINQDSFYGSDYFIKRVGYEEKWDRVKRLGDTYYENELLERSVTEKYGSNLKIGKVENTAGAIGATGSGKLSIDEYIGHNLENKDETTTKGASLSLSPNSNVIGGVGINYANRDLESVTKNTVVGNVEIGKSSGDEINKDLASMTEITKDKDTKTDIFIESQTINYIKNPEKFKEDLQKAKNEVEDLENVIENTINLPGEDKRNIFENLRAQRWSTSYYNVIGSRVEELGRQFKARTINEEDLKEAVRDIVKGYGKDIGIDFDVVYLDESTMPKDSEGSTGSSYIVDRKKKMDKVIFVEKEEEKQMKYEYQGIKLGDSIEKIIDLLNNKNTKLNDAGTDLIYEPGSTIEDISTRIYICLYTGIVVMIKIFDKDFCLAEDLKIGTPISKEMIEKYGLYEDDIAEDEGYYESIKYKKLVINIDWGTGRLERYNDGIERIIGYTFYEQDGLEFNIRKDEVDNYLECKNLKDIFYSLKKIYAIEVDVDKREIYGQLDNYKFTFDLVTRNIKSIQNLETREFIKTSLE